ncbi:MULTISPECIES: carbohydrate ABC transporter permease [Pseudothermotoga]|jgi:sn-glycerol 3-phosphate transport system permease protein|uniref:Binding-protein-dependent transport systems inner membrane component n=1 Tax=Pseudothermotoga lettingae (strain ATCC BAA-301 / DSM 14385 / NBRC 107922 / TMO) TaxID=416591 RepID=A8F7L1_PSELT|nr:MULTISPECIES: carbohydrate ABC transporter permease [Pseudothermotoga]ABV34145.1 binding-protein-dependent transport systems inner membrane component [Pseudothermotoga lettingae TMO]KUK21500.1 MAG: Binding-protein-dependent transport systems inner membrane component [Pseudothermotoga lettingae]MDI3495152.1 sn-glycerol 3-phosphate transport system permease protein [Pseudothermotoga sp.]GLI48911.1 glycerol-3-phosphate ABC transporter permease [Pseudothermotoga lettingae TMO]HBJ81439.1 carbohy
MRKSTRKTIKVVTTEIFLIIASIFMFAPVFLAIVMSIQPPEFVFSYPPKFLPQGFFTKNYLDAFKIVPFARMMLNSAIIAVLITFGKLISGTLSGYAYANFQFRGSRISFYILFATLFIPSEIVLIVPLFKIVSKFGWTNTYMAMTIPFMASATNTFLMQQHFKTIPREFEDAAKIDGAGSMQYFFRIVLPLSRPIIAGAAIINFTYAWNMYLWPLIVAMEDKMKTVQVAINMIINAESSNNWGIIMAGTVIALAPTLLLFFTLQDLFVKSLVSTGIKG